MSYLSERLVENAMDKVQFPAQAEGCWLFVGKRDRAGYGIIQSHGKTQLAHRVFYRHFIGEPEPGSLVIRTCKERSCVNPEHMTTGDAGDARYIRWAAEYESLFTESLFIRSCGWSILDTSTILGISSNTLRKLTIRKREQSASTLLTGGQCGGPGGLLQGLPCSTEGDGGSNQERQEPSPQEQVCGPSLCH